VIPVQLPPSRYNTASWRSWRALRFDFRECVTKPVPSSACHVPATRHLATQIQQRQPVLRASPGGAIGRELLSLPLVLTCRLLRLPHRDCRRLREDSKSLERPDRPPGRGRHVRRLQRVTTRIEHSLLLSRIFPARNFSGYKRELPVSSAYVGFEFTMRTVTSQHGTPLWNSEV
jgi:hypothetical protein